MNNGWYLIWWISEFLNIGLGRLAPYIFSKMLGNKEYERVDEDDDS